MVVWATVLKTTIRLPNDLKSALRSAATVTGSTEADIIREGIRLFIERHGQTAPRSGVFDSGDPHAARRNGGMPNPADPG